MTIPLLLWALVTLVFLAEPLVWRGQSNHDSQGVETPFWPSWGFNLSLGFNEGTKGHYSGAFHVPENLMAQALDGKLFVETELRRVVTPKEANAFFLEKALHFIWNSPDRVWQMALAKVGLFFSAFEPSEEHSVAALSTLVPWVRFLPLTFGVLMGLFPLGAVLLFAGAPFQQKRCFFVSLLFVVYPLIFCLLTVVFSRYRHACLIPYAIGFGALAQFLVTHLRMLWARQLKPSLKLAAVTAFLCLLLVESGGVSIPQVENQNTKHTRRMMNNALDLSTPSENLSVKASAERLLALAQSARHSEAYREARILHARQPYVDDSSTLIDLRYSLWMSDTERCRWLMTHWSSAIAPDTINQRLAPMRGIDVLRSRILLELNLMNHTPMS